MKKYSWIWALVLLFPLLSGCSTSDDVKAIFTGKTWKLTYISQGKGSTWYKYPDVTESNYKEYDPANPNARKFTIEFSGAEQNDVITGSFNGTGSVSMKGTWNANGESKAFNAEVSGSATISDKSDKLAAKIVEALKTADKYSGDENNLFIHFTYEKDRVFLAFAPVK